jgi:hypothetical protein
MPDKTTSEQRASPFPRLGFGAPVDMPCRANLYTAGATPINETSARSHFLGTRDLSGFETAAGVVCSALTPIGAKMSGDLPSGVTSGEGASSATCSVSGAHAEAMSNGSWLPAQITVRRHVVCVSCNRSATLH